jgi:hypothetical protein
VWQPLTPMLLRAQYFGSDCHDFQVESFSCRPMRHELARRRLGVWYRIGLCFVTALPRPLLGELPVHAKPIMHSCDGCSLTQCVKIDCSAASSKHGVRLSQ